MSHYSDPRIKCSDEAIALHYYYFPFGTKRIPLERIRGVREHDMGEGVSGGRWRIWGSGDLTHWMPLDAKRPKKRTMFVLLLEGTSIKPCITPDHPEAFRKFLAEKNIELAPLEEPYKD